MWAWARDLPPADGAVDTRAVGLFALAFVEAEPLRNRRSRYARRRRMRTAAQVDMVVTVAASVISPAMMPVAAAPLSAWRVLYETALRHLPRLIHVPLTDGAEAARAVGLVAHLRAVKGATRHQGQRKNHMRHGTQYTRGTSPVREANHWGKKPVAKRQQLYDNLRSGCNRFAQ